MAAFAWTARQFEDGSVRPRPFARRPPGRCVQARARGVHVRGQPGVPVGPPRRGPGSGRHRRHRLEGPCADRPPRSRSCRWCAWSARRSSGRSGVAASGCWPSGQAQVFELIARGAPLPRDARGRGPAARGALGGHDRRGVRARRGRTHASRWPPRPASSRPANGCSTAWSSPRPARPARRSVTGEVVVVPDVLRDPRFPEAALGGGPHGRPLDHRVADHLVADRAGCSACCWCRGRSRTPPISSTAPGSSRARSSRRWPSNEPRTRHCSGSRPPTTR